MTTEHKPHSSLDELANAAKLYRIHDGPRSEAPEGCSGCEADAAVDRLVEQVEALRSALAAGDEFAGQLEEQYEVALEASRQYRAEVVEWQERSHRFEHRAIDAEEQLDALHRTFEKWADEWDATGTAEVYGPDMARWIRDKWREALNPAKEPPVSVWRMSVIIEMDAENIDQAESIGRVVWERCAPVCQEIEGVKWMLPVGDFKERGVFAAASNQEGERP